MVEPEISEKDDDQPPASKRSRREERKRARGNFLLAHYGTFVLRNLDFVSLKVKIKPGESHGELIHPSRCAIS